MSKEEVQPQPQSQSQSQPQPQPQPIQSVALSPSSLLVSGSGSHVKNSESFHSLFRDLKSKPHGIFSSNTHPQRMLRVEVEDSGIGIHESKRSDLFQPFKQAQRRVGGTGLGLYSIMKRVECLGGDCGVMNRRDGGVGSCFWFRVPYRPDDSLSLEQAGGGADAGAGADVDASAVAVADATHDTECNFINVHLLEELLHLHFHARKGRKERKSDCSHRTQHTVTISNCAFASSPSNFQ